VGFKLLNQPPTSFALSVSSGGSANLLNGLWGGAPSPASAPPPPDSRACGCNWGSLLSRYMCLHGLGRQGGMAAGLWRVQSLQEGAHMHAVGEGQEQGHGHGREVKKPQNPRQLAC
jgi:hypothetical protein